MTSKGKSTRKDDATGGVTMEAITALFEQQREALAGDFRAALANLETKFDQVQTTVEDHGQRLSSLELVSEDMGERLVDLEKSLSSLSEANLKLHAKVVDLEGRSRRQNVRILGLAESTESGRPTEFFQKLLCEVFGDTLSSAPEIDRAHRVGAARDTSTRRPRPVILRLHRYQVKDLLVREARRRDKLMYRGQQIRLVEAYAPELLAQRAEYREVMTKLYNQGCRPSLWFPARLHITLPGGEKKWLKSAEEAQKYIDSLPKE